MLKLVHIFLLCRLIETSRCVWSFSYLNKTKYICSKTANQTWTYSQILIQQSQFSKFLELVGKRPNKASWWVITHKHEVYNSENGNCIKRKSFDQGDSPQIPKTKRKSIAQNCIATMAQIKRFPFLKKATSSGFPTPDQNVKKEQHLKNKKNNEQLLGPYCLSMCARG